MKTFKIPYPLTRVRTGQLEIALQMLEVHIQSEYGVSTLCRFCKYPDVMDKMKEAAFGYNSLGQSYCEHLQALLALIKHCIPFPAQFIAKFHMHQFSAEILCVHKVALDNLEDDVEAWTHREITMQLLASLTAAGAVLMQNKIKTGHAQYLVEYISAIHGWPKSRAEETEPLPEPSLDDQCAADSEAHAERAEIQAEGER